MPSNFDFKNTFSKSKLELFKTCKKAYHFYYLDEVISPNKRDYKKAFDFKTLGQAVHNAITLFYYLKPEERNLEKLKKLLLPCWKSEIMSRKNPPLGKYGGFESLEHERKKYGEALILLENFFKMADLNAKPFYLPTNDLDHSINDYYEWAVTLKNPLFKLSGKVDMVEENNDGTLKVIDFKTGGRSDSNFQLKLYKFLVEKRFEKKVLNASFYYLKDKSIEDFSLEDESLESIEDEVILRINEIFNEKEFLPNVSKLCKFCDFFEICPANNEAQKLMGQTSKEDYSDDLPF